MCRGRRNAIWRMLAVLIGAAMLIGLLPLSAGAEGRSAILDASEAHRAAGKPGAQEIPAEVRELFEGGMTAADFVEIAGYVPRALESLIDEKVLVIIEMEGEPVAAMHAAQGGGPGLSSSLQAHMNALEAAQASLQAQIEPLGAQVISNYTVVYNGIQARVPMSQLAAIRALPGVVAVHRAPVHEPTLGASVPLIAADQLWADLGYDGTGIVIAVIDTGIDYTHAALGGSGSPLQYQLNDPDVVEPGSFPTVKVVQGYDFAGTLYDAGCSAQEEADGICSATPAPDDDPLDEYGHGTHVASIAAGIMAGDVMTGTAPAAGLMALKVFGRSGSTTLTIDALEYATLHYLTWGWPQVINMSLGSPFGVDDPNDPSVYGANLAASVGIVVVASAGNEGDTHFITGSPAVADKAISVAATTTGYATGPTINVEGAMYVTQTNIIYQPGGFDDNTGRFEEAVTATLRYVGNLAGAADNQLCSVSGIAAGALEGDIALISRGTCAFSQKVNNAAALGAVAAVIYNNTSGIITMIGDPVAIPACSIQQQDGVNLIAADGETAVISAEDDVTTVPDPYTPADEIASFSSRGPRGYDSILKPDVSAPGVAIFAANMATGVGGVSMNGTSMAAPHVAGVAALIKQAHPDWTPEEVKAALMNTVADVEEDGETAPIPRRGMGRVDAYRAATTEVLAIGEEDLVSLNWGVVRTIEDAVTLTGTVTVHNKGLDDLEYWAEPGFQPGSETAGVVDLFVDPITFTVPAGGSVDVTVTIELDMTTALLDYSWLEEYYGALFLEPAGEDSSMLTVPFYFQVKPYTSLEIEASGTITHPLEDIAVITATHSGPITSALWVYPSLVANDEPNPDLMGAGDVRLFGMDWQWTSDTYGDMIDVAIAAWDWWHVPQPYFAEFDLYLDIDQDGTDDYVLFNFNYGWLSGGEDTNLWIVAQVDLATGMIYLGSPYTIHTDYHNAYMEWYVPAVWIDLGPDASMFDYQLVSWDTYGVAGVNPRGSFDYLKPPFVWVVWNDPGPMEPAAEVWVAAYSVKGYRISDPVGVMLVDYTGDPRNHDGAQAYLVPIEILQKYETFQPIIMRNYDSAELLLAP